MPGPKRIYRPKRIKKTTRRAFQKRKRPRQVTKAQIRREYLKLLEGLDRDLRRFQRSRHPQGRRDLARRMHEQSRKALEVRPRSTMLRRLRDESAAVLQMGPRDLLAADLSPLEEAIHGRTAYLERKGRGGAVEREEE
ncbi:MAG: hypothetical protein GF355_09160 [Candidatus Eisenbacteria bacterium]|nr:hypothetical protein [Candidatus Eisenbacteria bacterium]